MRTNDVSDDRPGMFSRRNDALFDCLCEAFFPHQLQSGLTGPTDKYTLVFFQDDAEIIFTDKPLGLARVLTDAAADIVPESHGRYLPALNVLETLLDFPLGMMPQATTVLFMSDGRPSDSIPAGKGVSATEKLSNMLVRRLTAAVEGCVDSAKAGKSVFSFHTLGFGPAGDFDILKAMAQSIPNGMGTFHLAGLNARALAQAMSCFSSSIEESRLSSKQLGAARPLRDVMMRKTSAISEFAYKLYTDAIIYEAPPTVESDWVTRGKCKVEVATEAFANGGERNAFFFRYKNQPAVQWVAKEGKYVQAAFDQELEFHNKKLAAQVIASARAVEFSSLPALLRTRYKISFAVCYFCLTTQTPQRLLFVEPFFEGKFRKWNSNNGNVYKAPTVTTNAFHAILEDEDEDEDDSYYADTTDMEEVPQAFSHWSHYVSSLERQPQLICDLQGFVDAPRKKFTFIDPVIHSRKRGTFAKTDHGQQGIDNFYSSHTCGALCRAILPRNEWRTSASSVGSSKIILSSTLNTSQVVVNKTNHLQMRQDERGIVTRELQAAVKHGTKKTQHDGRVMHEHGGVKYVTDRMGKVGITGYRK